MPTRKSMGPPMRQHPLHTARDRADLSNDTASCATSANDARVE